MQILTQNLSVQEVEISLKVAGFRTESRGGRGGRGIGIDGLRITCRETFLFSS